MNADEANKQIQELEQLRLQTRRFRLCTILAIVAIVVGGVTAIINSVYSLTIPGPKQERFLREFGANLQKDVLPVVQKIASASIERLKPAVDAELQKINARTPEVADAALREIDRLGYELPIRAEKILDQTVGLTIEKREAKLRQMFPGAYDKELPVLVENLNLEVQDQLANAGEKIFHRHLNSIQSILANLEKIQKTEAIDPKTKVDPWQVAFLFVDLFDQEFKDLAKVNQTAKSKETSK
jgi:hypothetical protein